MAPAVYRLFTFVPWEFIPEDHKKFFPEGAEKEWDKDLKDYKEEHLLLDLDTEVKAVLKALNKRLIVQALALMPIILADFFVLGNPMDSLQLKLKTITDNYINNLSLVSQEEAETIAMFDLVDMLEPIVNKIKTDITDNFQKVVLDMFAFYSKDNEKKKERSKVMEVLGSERDNE